MCAVCWGIGTERGFLSRDSHAARRGTLSIPEGSEDCSSQTLNALLAKPFRHSVRCLVLPGKDSCPTRRAELMTSMAEISVGGRGVFRRLRRTRLVVSLFPCAEAWGKLARNLFATVPSLLQCERMPLEASEAAAIGPALREDVKKDT